MHIKTYVCPRCGVFTNVPVDVHADFHCTNPILKDNSTLAERCKMPSPSQVESEIIDRVEGGNCSVQVDVAAEQDLVDRQLQTLAPADLEIYYSLGTDEQKRIYLDRQKVYGSCTRSHQEIGAAWTAYLNNALGTNLAPLKGYQVAHLLTIFKVLRGGKVFHDDNYVDGHNYFEFAHCMQKHNA